jgi:hypothetical protein
MAGAAGPRAGVNVVRSAGWRLNARDGKEHHS